MILSKEISFDGLDEKVSKWCKECDFLGNPPIDAQLALDLIFKTLIDDKKHFEYLTTMPESTEQINSIKLDLILWEYSRLYRKWKKKKVKKCRREKWL